MSIRRRFEPWDPRIAAPTAGALLVGGAVMTLLAAVVHPPRDDAARVVVTMVPALLVACGVVLLSPRGRRSSPLLTLAPLVALAAIAGLNLVTGDAALTGHLFFLLPVLYAASQLRAGPAVVVTAAAIAVDAAVAFTLSPPLQALTDVAYMSTTLVAVAVVLVLKRRRQGAIVQELREGKQALVRQATHDALTGLPNRALFHERVRQALSPRTPAPGHRWSEGDRRTARDVGGVAVLFCDLDGFKQVNDTLGHRAGDELLIAVAHRLRSHVRSADVVARLGGDEFAVLLEDSDQTGACLVADRILAALTDAVAIAGQQVHVGVSIGITWAAPGAGTSVDALVREADVAMYEAKAAGRGTRVVFAPAMLESQVEQASLIQDLHGAVGRGEIVVEYQPVVDLASGRVDGLEALSRWAHPRRGLVSPAVFIPLAERAGLIDEVGAFVLAEATRHAASWSDAARRPITIGVNVSAHQLTKPTLLAAIPTGNTPAMQLLLEVTESTLVRPDVIPVLEELRRRGVRIAMDDFGVGQSSIAALRVMPVDIIKLDRAFTVDVATDPRAAGIVRAVTGMARELGLALVAEGIETPEQLHALTGIGATLGQGFLLARPMSASAMRRYLHERAAPPAHVIPAPGAARAATSPARLLTTTR